MWDPRLNLLALWYRILYTILGGYITAALAPHSPMRHVVIGGVIGSVVGTAGAIAAITIGGSRPGLVSDCPRGHGLSVCVAGRRDSR